MHNPTFPDEHLAQHRNVHSGRDELRMRRRTRPAEVTTQGLTTADSEAKELFPSEVAPEVDKQHFIISCSKGDAPLYGAYTSTWSVKPSNMLSS
uniref:TFIIIC_delta domain-containing protein n=1 Tax=Steinernema glaseri TaxID=37863 RepID=A0A1I8AA14_9BILA